MFPTLYVVWKMIANLLKKRKLGLLNISSWSLQNFQVKLCDLNSEINRTGLMGIVIIIISLYIRILNRSL